MGLLGRWLSNTVALAFGLAGALAAMQAPALAQHYLGGLEQARQELDRSAAARLASARDMYQLGGSERGMVASLATHEPSNAATLGRDLDRRDGYAAILDRAEAAGPVLRPLATLAAVTAGPEGWRAPVLQTALASFEPAISLTPAALAWGFAGLVLGELLAQLVAAPFRTRRRRFAV